MAKSGTLLDKMNQKKSTTPTQELASSRGLAASPVTAYGTSLIGGTEDQAKMAGTPAQKTAAIAAATKIAAPTGETELEKETTLGEAKESPEDIAKKQQAQKYSSSLGTYGAKVTEWIDSAKKNMVSQAATVQIDASDALLAGLPTDKKEQAITLLKQIATSPDEKTRLEGEKELNIILGKDINSILDATQKQDLYKNVSDSVAAATQAGQIAVVGQDRLLNVGDISQLGTTVEELSSLIKASPDELSKMTLSQLQGRIEQATKEQFGTTAEVQRGMASEMLSPAERAALRGYLRSMESTGVSGAEVGVAGLVQQIDSQNQLTFAGKKYTLDELFSSDVFTNLMTQAVAEIESKEKTGPILESLKKDSPETYDWLTKNYNGVKQLLATSTATSTQFKSIQDYNKGVIGTLGKTQPELAKAFGVDPTQLRTNKLDPNALPSIFKFVNNLPPESQATTAANLADLSHLTGPEELAKLSEGELASLDVNNPTGPAAQYKNATRDANVVNSAANIQDVIHAISSQDESIEDFNDYLTGDALAVALGIEPSNASQLDANKDGVIDDKDLPDIKKNFASSVPSLSAFVQGQKPQTATNSFTYTPPKGGDAITQNVFNTIKPLLGDKKIDENERGFIRDLARPMSEDELQSLVNRNWSSVPGGETIRYTLNESLQDKISKRMQKEREEKAAVGGEGEEGEKEGRGRDKTYTEERVGAVVAEGKKAGTKVKSGVETGTTKVQEGGSKILGLKKKKK